MPRRGNPRIDEAVKQAVARVLKEDIGDPRLRHVTITDVRVSEDHRQATVYYTSLEPDLLADESSAGDRLADDEAVAEGLASAAPRIQGLVSTQVRLRNTPRLDFEPDDVAREARRIDQLLRRVREDSP